MTADNAGPIARAGADVLVAGSAIFKGDAERLRQQHRRYPQRGNVDRRMTDNRPAFSSAAFPGFAQ